MAALLLGACGEDSTPNDNHDAAADSSLADDARSVIGRADGGVVDAPSDGSVDRSVQPGDAGSDALLADVGDGASGPLVDSGAAGNPGVEGGGSAGQGGAGGAGQGGAGGEAEGGASTGGQGDAGPSPDAMPDAGERDGGTGGTLLADASPDVDASDPVDSGLQPEAGGLPPGNLVLGASGTCAAQEVYCVPPDPPPGPYEVQAWPNSCPIDATMVNIWLPSDAAPAVGDYAVKSTVSESAKYTLGPGECIVHAGGGTEEWWGQSGVVHVVDVDGKLTFQFDGVETLVQTHSAQGEQSRPSTMSGNVVCP